MEMLLRKNKVYLYHHLIPDTKEVFYVGVGGINRLLETRNRNEAWKNQFDKTGFVLRVVEEFACRKDALLAEVESIKRLKEKGFKLTNITNGGLGMSGVKPWNANKKNIFSKETLEKISEKSKKRYSIKENRIEHSKNCGGGKLFCAKTKNAGIVHYLGYIQKECADLLSLRQGAISLCLQNKRNSHKGYVFGYI